MWKGMRGHGGWDDSEALEGRTVILDSILRVFSLVVNVELVVGEYGWC